MKGKNVEKNVEKNVIPNILNNIYIFSKDGIETPNEKAFLEEGIIK